MYWTEFSSYCPFLFVFGGCQFIKLRSGDFFCQSIISIIFSPKCWLTHSRTVGSDIFIHQNEIVTKMRQNKVLQYVQGYDPCNVHRLETHSLLHKGVWNCRYGYLLKPWLTNHQTSFAQQHSSLRVAHFFPYTPKTINEIVKITAIHSTPWIWWRWQLIWSWANCWRQLRFSTVKRLRTAGLLALNCNPAS